MRKYLRWPVLLILAALVVAALVPAFSLLHTGSLSKAHASGAASITLSSATGQPGTTLQASGQGFAPNDQINLYLNQVNGPLLASASADGSGNLPATNITVPSQPAGQYTVVAMQAQSDISANTTLTIVPIFSLSQKKVQPGALVGVKGAGFPFEDMIELFLDSTSGNSFTYGEDDYYGNISWSVNLPASSVVQGQHVIIAKSDTTGNILDFPVTFLPRAFPIVAKAGMAVQLTGASFAANETVQIYWGTQTGKLEGSATTDATGNLSFSFTAPSGLTPGSYPITVVRSHHKPALVLTQFKLIPVIMTSTPGILSGQPVKVAVTGFLPNENVTFAWNANGGQQLDSYWTDKNGALQTEFFPPSAPVGSYTLTATGGTSGLQASNSLNIGPGVSGGYADPGSTITVTGGGFSAGETVNVYFQKPENGLVSVTTSASGSFTVQLTLPSTYNPSTIYYIYAVSATGNEQAAAKFTFYKLSFITSGYAYYNQTELYSGTNFAVNEIVNIIWNYQQPGQYTIATVQADGSGSFNVYIVTPSTPDESTIVIAAVGITSKLTATSSLVNYVTISGAPATGVKGTKVVVSGGSFGCAETVVLSFQGIVLTSVTSNANGTFTASFKVPADSGAGNVIIKAVGISSGVSATTVFNYTPFLTVNPSIVHNGDTIVVTGKHFSASTNVFVYWPGGSVLGNPVYTDVNGSFTLTVQISGAASGADAVSAQDMLSNLFVSTPLVVE